MRERGLGKCVENHLGSFGYPSRPEATYTFCPQCGNVMVWACPKCNLPVPDDSDDLTSAAFCRDCGSPYFDAKDRADR